MKQFTPDEIRAVVEQSGRAGYIDIPADEYHAMTDFSSNSMLRRMKLSAAKYRLSLQQTSRSSPAQSLGTAIHMALLEPELFDKTYAIMPRFDRRTKDGKAKAEEWELAYKGRTAISQDDMDVIHKLHQKVFDDDFYQQFFSKGAKESSFFAIDEKTGMKVRCRCDNMLEEKNIIVDLKTTDCADEYVFNSDITKYGYLTQGAFYMDVVHAATGVRPDAFVIIAVEKTNDCDMNAFYFDDEALEVGRRQYRQWLERLQSCVVSNNWPGYERKFIKYRMPAWQRDMFLEESF